MASHSSSRAWEIPDKGAWSSTVQGTTKDSNMTEHVLGLGNRTVLHLRKKVETEAILYSCAGFSML